MKTKLHQYLLIAVAMHAMLGCVPVALVAGSAATSGAVAGDPRPFATISDDQDAAFQANTRLAADEAIDHDGRVVASVYNRTLLLTGEVPTPALRMQAEQRVKNVPNVKRIYNQITLGAPISALRQSDDALLTTNIKARMLATTNLKSNQFKVITENGVVYLMGLTSREQASIAADVTRHSAGVKQVVKVIEYTP